MEVEVDLVAVVVKAPAAKKVRYSKKATNRYLTPRRRHLYHDTAIDAGVRLVLTGSLNTMQSDQRSNNVNIRAAPVQSGRRAQGIQ